MSALTDPGQRVAGNASSALLLGVLNRQPFGVFTGELSGFGTSAAVLAARRTVNAPDDYADYSVSGATLPGYLLTHGARLLVMAGDKQTVQSIADAYDHPASVPFYTADGVQHNVPVEVSFLPFQSASGTVVNLAVI